MDVAATTATVHIKHNKICDEREFMRLEWLGIFEHCCM